LVPCFFKGVQCIIVVRNTIINFDLSKPILTGYK